ncbi:MAG: 23S rRNA (adenine(2503)-C(2))-methyltransferase RlmN [Treponema phagedenis]|uniref:23S rRNA (adenine(2503)-C(2))-methyltransferase RlmN n=1 Tax=Treponema phagedenis TaxID=162 RepID=UPI003134177B
MDTQQTAAAPVLSGLLPEEISSVCGLTERFHGLQIFQWIARGCNSFADMTNLPLRERERLAGSCLVQRSVCGTVLTDPDGTVKLGIDLHDGSRIETVLLFDQNGRKTACVSSQVGCPMGCTFCQTGQIGYLRNLTADEITEQFFHLEKICGKLDNIVFMGMGEPLLNLDAAAKTVAILTHPKGRNLSHRRITLSTSGICKGIYELADRKLDIRLAVSLTAADEQLRTELMPVTKSNPLSELKKAILYFNRKTDKRVTLELALLKNINTSRQAAQQVSAFADGLDVHLNLIPWNPVAELPFKTPSDSEVRAFYSYLIARRLNVTVRQKRGRTIGGACGQLGKKGTI